MTCQPASSSSGDGSRGQGPADQEIAYCFAASCRSRRGAGRQAGVRRAGRPAGSDRGHQREARRARAPRHRHTGVRRAGEGDHHGDRAHARLRSHRPGDREAGLRHREPHPRYGPSTFIEVKGRVHGADTITVTRNEVLYSMNKPEDYRLAIVEFLDDGAHRVHYLREPFRREPDFDAASVNYSFKDLLARAEPPC
ncbi:MAG: DUF3883 domain-containing protein [Spirochaetaceae bacterium]|nr:DUF3883 domain-containing protein [Spirochaetaceae bacterium]